MRNHVLPLKNFDADITLSDIQNATPYFTTAVHADFKLYENNGVFYQKLPGADSSTLSLM